MMVCGPSQAGKTVFVKKLIENVDSVLNVVPEEIIWCYSEYQPAYASLVYIPNLRFIEGMPNFNELKNNRKKLIILDDLLESSLQLTPLFTKGCHHWNMSCVHIVQNIFYKSLRTSRINTHYLVLFKNPADKSQIHTLARQLYPKNSQILLDAFADATSVPYTFLLIDLTQTTPENLRLRSDIFGIQTVYVPKNDG